ncbi:MAG: hypothetical protein SNJ74_11485 [Fimbriimonadaceae bacterium]
MALADELLAVPDPSLARRWTAAHLLKGTDRHEEARRILMEIDDPEPFFEYFRRLAAVNFDVRALPPDLIDELTGGDDGTEEVQ